MNPLASILKAMGISPADASGMFGVPASLITSVLLGERPTIPMKLMFALAEQGFTNNQIANFCTTYDAWRNDQRYRTA